MQYANPGDTWTEWVEDNADRDDDTKLAALREIITESARTWVGNGEITGEWADKKLAKLGITERVGVSNTYTVEAPVSGNVRLSIVGRTRAEALADFSQRMGSALAANIASPVVQGAPTVVSGPEDPDPNVIDPNVPTTVQGTLDMLRETILLGTVSGPWFCVHGADRVLAGYGLDPVPPRKQFVVTRPVEAVMRTVVDAFDEVSAMRVAGWRWDNGRSGHEVSEATVVGLPSVDEN